MEDHTKSNSEANRLEVQSEEIGDAGVANANDIREAFLGTLEGNKEAGEDVEAPTATGESDSDESEVMNSVPEDVTAPGIAPAIRAYLENTGEAHQQRKEAEDSKKVITA